MTTPLDDKVREARGYCLERIKKVSGFKEEIAPVHADEYQKVIEGYQTILAALDGQERRIEQLESQLDTLQANYNAK